MHVHTHTHTHTWCRFTISVNSVMSSGPTVVLIRTLGGSQVFVWVSSLWMLIKSSIPRSMRDGELKSNLRHNCSALVLNATVIIWHKAPPELKSSNSPAGNLVRVGLLTCLPKVSYVKVCSEVQATPSSLTSWNWSSVQVRAERCLLVGGSDWVYWWALIRILVQLVLLKPLLYLFAVL